MKKSVPLYLAALLAIISCAGGVIIGSAYSLTVADWIGFFGAVFGAVITIVGAYAVFHLQNRATDRRQLGTITALLSNLRTAGEIMSGANSALDPATCVNTAMLSYMTAESVAQHIRANGPRIAYVAQRLEHSTAKQGLIRLQRTIESGGGIAAPDLAARGDEVTGLAELLLDKLNAGL